MSGNPIVSQVSCTYIDRNNVHTIIQVIQLKMVSIFTVVLISLQYQVPKTKNSILCLFVTTRPAGTTVIKMIDVRIEEFLYKQK
jgi:hypothetical protein